MVHHLGFISVDSASSIDIGLDDARLYRKDFAGHQSFNHEMAQDRLKHMAQGVTVAESAVTILGESGMIWNRVLQARAAAQTVGNVQMNLLAWPVREANANAVAFEPSALGHHFCSLAPAEAPDAMGGVVLVWDGA